MFDKLKRVWSHGYANYIPKMREVFPELKKLSDEEMCERWIELDIEFYTVTEKKVRWWIRITLPFALILLLLMFIGLPIYFIIFGKWGYSIQNKTKLYNWFKELRLV